MKKFLLNVLERITANIIYSIGVVVMLTIIGICIQYNKEYLWFLPVSIGFLLIILLLIMKAISIHYKNKKARGDDKKEKQIADIQLINGKLTLQDKEFMSLKTVFSKFKEEIKRESPEDYHSMGSMMERQNQDQESIFVMRFGQSIDVDIYGKITSPSFQDWVKIDEDLFFNCKIKNGSELYCNNILGYTDLAIKKSDLEKAIIESKLSLTDEFISRLYKFI